MTTEEFNKLTPEAQRVLVAQDVIKQLNIKKYKSTPGTYAEFQSTLFTDDKFENSNVELNKHFNTLRNCEVCARGALFLSTVNLGNAFPINKISIHSYDTGRAGVAAYDLGKRLNPIFSMNQQALIECAYEGIDVSEHLKTVVITYNIHQKELGIIQHLAYKGLLNECKKFKKKYPKSKDRMIAIMRNIIRNKGIFKIN